MKMTWKNFHPKNLKYVYEYVQVIRKRQELYSKRTETEMEEIRKQIQDMKLEFNKRECS